MTQNPRFRLVDDHAYRRELLHFHEQEDADHADQVEHDRLERERHRDPQVTLGLLPRRGS